MGGGLLQASVLAPQQGVLGGGYNEINGLNMAAVLPVQGVMWE